MAPYGGPSSLHNENRRQHTRSTCRSSSVSPSPPSFSSSHAGGVDRRRVDPRRNRSGSRPVKFLQDTGSSGAGFLNRRQSSRKAPHDLPPSLPLSPSQTKQRKRRLDTTEGEERVSSDTQTQQLSPQPSLTSQAAHSSDPNPDTSIASSAVSMRRDNQDRIPCPCDRSASRPSSASSSCNMAVPSSDRHVHAPLSSSTPSSPSIPSHKPHHLRPFSEEKDQQDRMADQYHQQQTWEVPCGFNPEVSRTLRIEYWDRTQECKERKWDHLDYIDANYSSREKWIRSSVFKDGELDTVLEPNMFAYNTPVGVEHWTLWCTRDLSLTEVEKYVHAWIKNQRPEVRRWNWDENAQRSIDIYHVHVYFQVVPDESVQPPQWPEGEVDDRRRRSDEAGSAGRGVEGDGVDGAASPSCPLLPCTTEAAEEWGDDSGEKLTMCQQDGLPPEKRQRV